MMYSSTASKTNDIYYIFITRCCRTGTCALDAVALTCHTYMFLFVVCTITVFTSSGTLICTYFISHTTLKSCNTIWTAPGIAYEISLAPHFIHVVSTNTQATHSSPPWLCTTFALQLQYNNVLLRVTVYTKKKLRHIILLTIVLWFPKDWHLRKSMFTFIQ